MKNILTSQDQKMNKIHPRQTVISWLICSIFLTLIVVGIAVEAGKIWEPFGVVIGFSSIIPSYIAFELGSMLLFGKSTV